VVYKESKKKSALRGYYVFFKRVAFRILDFGVFRNAEIPIYTFFIHRLHFPWSNEHTAAVFFPPADIVPVLLDGDFCSLMQLCEKKNHADMDTPIQSSKGQGAENYSFVHTTVRVAGFHPLWSHE